MEKRISRKLLGGLSKYFLRGVLLAGPLFITLFVIWSILGWVNELTNDLLAHIGLSPIPGTGIALTLALITLLGWISNSILVKPIAKWIDAKLAKVPLVKLLYSSLRDFLSAFVGKKKKFSEAVMVKSSPTSEIYKLGFITRKDLSFLGFEKQMLAVYLPHSYNFSGNMWIVPSYLIKPLDAKPSEVMKLIVTGGVSGFTNEEDEFPENN